MALLATFPKLFLVIISLFLLFINQTLATCNGAKNGNTERASGESCDDNGADPNRCDANCEIVAGYTCFDAANGSGLATCSEVCGDGIKGQFVGDNDCDDGDVTPRDGCSHTCAAENGWLCTGGGAASRDFCVEVCGD